MFLTEFDPCEDPVREDCHKYANCFGNITNDTFTCECRAGFEDGMPSNPGRVCNKKRSMRDGKFLDELNDAVATRNEMLLHLLNYRKISELRVNEPTHQNV